MITDREQAYHERVPGRTVPTHRDESLIHNAQAFIIEVQGRAAGIVVAEQSGFRFFAAEWLFHTLERSMYKQVSHVERAVLQVLSEHSKCNTTEAVRAMRTY